MGSQWQSAPPGSITAHAVWVVCLDSVCGSSLGSPVYSFHQFSHHPYGLSQRCPKLFFVAKYVSSITWSDAIGVPPPATTFTSGEQLECVFKEIIMTWDFLTFLVRWFVVVWGKKCLQSLLYGNKWYREHVWLNSWRKLEHMKYILSQKNPLLITTRNPNHSPHTNITSVHIYSSKNGGKPFGNQVPIQVLFVYNYTTA